MRTGPGRAVGASFDRLAEPARDSHDCPKGQPAGQPLATPVPPGGEPAVHPEVARCPCPAQFLGRSADSLRRPAVNGPAELAPPPERTCLCRGPPGSGPPPDGGGCPATVPTSTARTHLAAGLHGLLAPRSHQYWCAVTQTVVASFCPDTPRPARGSLPRDALPRVGVTAAASASASLHPRLSYGWDETTSYCPPKCDQ